MTGAVSWLRLVSQGFLGEKDLPVISEDGQALAFQLEFRASTERKFRAWSLTKGSMDGPVKFTGLQEADSVPSDWVKYLYAVVRLCYSCCYLFVNAS